MWGGSLLGTVLFKDPQEILSFSQLLRYATNYKKQFFLRYSDGGKSIKNKDMIVNYKKLFFWGKLKMEMTYT